MKYFNEQSKRIVELVDVLISKGIIPNERTFCLDIDYMQSIFHQVKNGFRGFPKKQYHNLTKVYNVNIEYITTGALPIFNDDTPSRVPLAPSDQSPSTPIIQIEKGQRGVPFYDIDVTASIVRSFNDIKETPEYFVDFRPFNDCKAWMPIYGDSMYPRFQSGEIVAIKQVSNFEGIQWGEPHLIITDTTYDLRTVKTIHPYDKDADKIILRATNPNYKGDTIVTKESILSLYIIKGKVTRFQI